MDRLRSIRALHAAAEPLLSSLENNLAALRAAGDHRPVLDEIQRTLNEIRTAIRQSDDSD